MKNALAISNKIITKRVLVLWSVVCFISISVRAQAPILGVSSSFALFTAAGAINNTGLTNVTGDIGTDVGAFNGFPPGIINGQIHVANSTSAQAAIDVDVAYSSLAAVICDSVLGVALGSGQTLLPKTYCIGAAAILNGNLILDAQGNPNALFIIKIDGAFSTGTSSHVILMNSAVVNNVYWQINGLFSIGNNADFKGIVIANGAINLLDSSSLEGQGLSRAGAITLSANNVLIKGNVVVPIELIAFKAACKNKKAHLEWTTATESSTDFFEVESSRNAIDWAGIGKIKAAEYSTAYLYYHFDDISFESTTTYYRLKQMDLNGQYKISESILFIGCSESTPDLKVFPNPGNGRLDVLMSDEHDSLSGVLVYNSFGELIYNSTLVSHEIDLLGQEDGFYFIEFYFNKSVITKMVLIKK